jgi:hypothetical protein
MLTAPSLEPWSGQFAERFPKGEIVATLPRRLAWSHFVELMAI